MFIRKINIKRKLNIHKNVQKKRNTLNVIDRVKHKQKETVWEVKILGRQKVHLYVTRQQEKITKNDLMYILYDRIIKHSHVKSLSFM